MATEMELLRTGVAALQAGDRESAIQALSQVVDMNPFNEQAWFYLAAADTDPFMRKRYLERVLELNAKNDKARDILNKLLTKEDALISNPPSSPKPLRPVAPLRPIEPKQYDTTDDDPLAAILNPIIERSPEPPTLSVSTDTTSIYSWDTPFSDDDADDMPDVNAFAPSKPSSRVDRTSIAADDDLLSRLGFGDEPDIESQSAAPKTERVTFKTLRPLAADAGSLLASSGESGFSLPFDIPGSPARVSFRSLLRGGFSLMRGSIRILTRRADVYNSEIERATWWRFLLYALFTGLIQSLFLALIVWIVDGRMSAATAGRNTNFFSGVVMMLLAAPFYVVTLMGGSAISYFVQRRVERIRTTFLKHLYAQSVVWLPLSLVATVLAFVFNLFNLVPVDSYSLLAIVATLLIGVYAALTHDDATRHFSGDPMLDEKARRRRHIVSASTVIGIFVVRVLVGLLLASITGVTLLVFLFS